MRYRSVVICKDFCCRWNSQCVYADSQLNGNDVCIATDWPARVLAVAVELIVVVHRRHVAHATLYRHTHTHTHTHTPCAQHNRPTSVFLYLFRNSQSSTLYSTVKSRTEMTIIITVMYQGNALTDTFNANRVQCLTLPVQTSRPTSNYTERWPPAAFLISQWQWLLCSEIAFQWGLPKVLHLSNHVSIISNSFLQIISFCCLT